MSERTQSESPTARSERPKLASTPLRAALRPTKRTFWYSPMVGEPREPFFTTVVLACTLAVVASCEAPADPYDLAPTPAGVELLFESPRLSFWQEPGLPVCGGTLAYMDRFAERYLAESSDGELSDPIVYFHLGADAIAAPELCGSASSCARSGHIYANNPVHTHEMVHALRDLQTGARREVELLEEGIAQLHYDVSVRWVDEFSVTDVLDHIDTPASPDLYDRVAHLLAYLAEESSWQATERFVDSAASMRDTASLDEALLASLGVDAAELDDDYSGYPRCSSLAVARLIVECSETPLAWTEAPWAATPFIIEGGSDFDCTASQAIGPRGGRFWRSYTVDVPQSGSYRLELDQRTGMRIQVVACDLACAGDPDSSHDGPNLDTLLSLSAGRHVFRASRALGDRGPVGFVLKGPL